MKEIFKKYKIAIIIIAVIIVAFLGMIIVLSSDQPIEVIYGEKYYPKGNKPQYALEFVLLNKDGTCNNATTKDMYCSYELEDTVLTVNTSLVYEGVKATIITQYNLVKDDELELFSTEVLINDTSVSTDDAKCTYIIRKSDDETPATSTTQPENINQKYYQQYSIVTMKSGAKAYIEFMANGNCRVNFSALNNKKMMNSVEYLEVKYVDGTCHYTTEDNVNFKITYNGYLEQNYHYYLDYNRSLNKQTIGTIPVMQEANIRFKNDYAAFDFLDGEFTYVGGEVFMVYYKSTKSTTTTNKEESNQSSNKSEEDNKVITGNQNTTTPKTPPTTTTTTNLLPWPPTSTTSTSRTTKKTTTSTTTKDAKTLSKERLDKVSIELKHSTAYTHYEIFKVLLTSEESNDETYKVTIDGEEFYKTIHESGIYYQYENVGKNCLTAEIADRYGNTKKVTKCINFEPVALNYKADLIDKGNGYYRLRFTNKDSEAAYVKNHYNYEANLTYKLDGQPITYTELEDIYLAIKGCNHTLVLTNKFGYSQTLKYSC